MAEREDRVSRVRAGEEENEMSRTKRKSPVPPVYRLVAGMSGRELLDGLAAPPNESMATLMRVEVELRLADGLKRRQR